MHKPLKTWLLAGLAATPLILGSVGPATAAVPLVQTVQWHHGWHGDGGGGWHGGGWRRHEAWRGRTARPLDGLSLRKPRLLRHTVRLLRILTGGVMIGRGG